jgi:hypothetical protein
MSNIRIDIASEFKDKGFKAAEKRTTSLNRKFDKLARTAKSTFIAIAGIQALKRSVVAFAEEDRAANKLEASLRNLGLAYDTKAIEDYLEQSEKATAISKDELSPAIAGLLSTTLDAEQSMRLLNLAMDISTSTGRDLTSVTTALSRAYNGNFASLGKLQTAYTAAELEAMGFEASVTALNNQFAGAAKNNADTYAGKIDKMKIAFGDLAEEIGAGIIAFLESLGDGDYDKGLQKLVDFGTAIGNVFRRAGLTIEYTKALLGTGFRIDAAEQFKLDELRAQLANPQMGEFGVNRGNLQNYAKQLELQKKIVKEREKAAKLSEKDKKNQAALARAKAVFDLEKIQIEAALQGKITEEERTRLLLMRAILEEDADKAEKLSARLEKIQAQTLELAESLTTLEANDPFAKWGDYFDEAKKNIKDLYDTLAKQQMALNELMTGIATGRATANANVLAAKTDKATTYLEAAQASSTFAGLSSADAVAAVAQAAAAVAAATTPEEAAAAQEAVDAANAYVDATTLLTESLAAADLAAALASLELANEYLNQSIEAATSQGIIPETTINVTVEGNVTSAEDLAEVITDIQYNYQKTGKGLLLSSRAI